MHTHLYCYMMLDYGTNNTHLGYRKNDRVLKVGHDHEDINHSNPHDLKYFKHPTNPSKYSYEWLCVVMHISTKHIMIMKATAPYQILFEKTSLLPYPCIRLLPILLATKLWSLQCISITQKYTSLQFMTDYIWLKNKYTAYNSQLFTQRMF